MKNVCPGFALTADVAIATTTYESPVTTSEMTGLSGTASQ